MTYTILNYKDLESSTPGAIALGGNPGKTKRFNFLPWGTEENPVQDNRRHCDKMK